MLGLLHFSGAASSKTWPREHGQSYFEKWQIIREHIFAHRQISVRISSYSFVVICLLLVTVLSISNNFTQDDGFITLRYVDHFLRGHGPVWYPESKEFGYTNFLFMLLVTAISLTGLDPIVSANIVSYSAFATSIVVTYLIARRLAFGNVIVAATAVVVIFSNYTVSSFASGLLETSLQTAFMTLTFYYVLAFSGPRNRPRYIYLATIAATLGLLTRLDTVLLIAPAFLLLFYGIWTAGIRRRRLAGHMAFALACAAIVLSAFLAFCFIFYGSILPNTFYAKTGQNFGFGLLYLSSFMLEELLVYPYLAAIVFIHWYRSEGRLPPIHRMGGFAFALSAAAVVWTGYALYVGGGFMGYRLMIPFILVFFLLAFTTIGKRFGTGFAVQLAVIVMLTQGAQYFWFSRLDNSADRKIETPTALDHHLTRPGANWQIIGRQLNDLFHHGEPDDVMIAVTAAGAIPYYARLPAFDIHGLNTREVAMHGAVVSTRPGHRRSATRQQMRQAGVNLIVTTQYVCAVDAHSLSYDELPRLQNRPGLPAVLIPLPSGDCWAVGYYLQPHHEVEDQIGRRRLVRIDAE